MKNRLTKKARPEEIWEEDVFGSYLNEMNELVSRYPDDPNEIDLNDRKLDELIKEVDKGWMAFKKKWQNKLKDVDKIFGTASIKKCKSGLRHLIIKSDFSSQDILDLSVSCNKKQK